jgi:AraC family transcriptional regulator of adaptative response / DNA-3-methyladenine glycosylase II
MRLDDDTCYRALLARDARFDGVFFTGVSTTGIYCRPVCPARTPRRERCTFYRSAATAERDGHRACFRCRPELAPGSASVDATSALVAIAVARIDAGALNTHSVDDLARRLGVSGRHLRRVMEAELGVSPVELAQSRRLALAKQLLHDSRLGMTEVALASGFGSLRRFHAAFRARFGRPPSQLRRESGRDDNKGSGALVVMLEPRQPYAWSALLAFLAARATPDVESVDKDGYRRTLRIGARSGWLSVARVPGRGRLRLEVAPSLADALMAVVAAVRRLLDLDAHPAIIDAHLASDHRMTAHVRTVRGLRVAGSVCGFETAVRVVLGQQVSVGAATTLAGRLARAFGEPLATPWPALTHLFPTAERLAACTNEEIAHVGVPHARAGGVRALARAVARGALALDPPVDVPDVIERLRALPGIGPWSAQMIAMRALSWPDAFPDGDLAVRQALDLNDARAVRAAAAAWSPWRAYAATHLWTHLAATRQATSTKGPTT